MIKGIMPPIATPFENGEISIAKLSDNISKWNESGISGYVVLGSNGESAFLTKEEKLNLIDGVKTYAASDKNVIAGTGSDSIKDTVSLTNASAEIGADAALILTPSFYKGQMNHDAFIRYFTEVADKIKIPLLIYNVPKFTGVNIEAHTVAKLAEHPNIIGMKNSSENVAHLAEVINNTPEEFINIVGTASVLYPGLSIGAKGGILALANIAPDQCCSIFNYYEEGKHKEAEALQKKMLAPNKAVTAKYGVAGLKAALDLCGFYGGQPRSPLGSLSEKDKSDLKIILISAGIEIKN